MKAFYVISALRPNSSTLGNLRKYETEEEAIEHAKEVIKQRSREGRDAMAFHILKVVGLVEPALPPIEVTKFE